jgi:NAD(P)-dependent dehydrogenase (short-subunit alcohol dehydrogenase family)
LNAVITGGDGGIGRAVAIAFAQGCECGERAPPRAERCVACR